MQDKLLYNFFEQDQIFSKLFSIILCDLFLPLDVSLRNIINKFLKLESMSIYNNKWI